MLNPLLKAALLVFTVTALGLFTQAAVVFSGFMPAEPPWGGWWIGLAATVWLGVSGLVWNLVRFGNIFGDR